MRLSRIHSRGYWIPTLSIKTEMHLGVDAYDMVQSYNTWYGAKRCGGAMPSTFSELIKNAPYQ
jgi:hypothetical protein